MPRAIVTRFRTPGQILWQTAEEFVSDRCPQMAASISFYALFSLPPLLVLLIMLVEPFLDPDVVVGIIEQEAAAFLGPRGAEQIEMLLENVTRPGQGGPIAATLGIGAFLFGATAAFGQLQEALNAAWQVAPNPERGGIANFLLKRVLSFAMILAIGVLLVSTLVLSTLLGAFGDSLELLAGWIPRAPVMRAIDACVTFTVVTLLFSSMYRFLPDARVGWGAAMRGGVATAILFTMGKTAIGYYLGQSDPGSAFGAAGSLAMVLIWIYYSSMILLVGAELTQVWMRARGEPIQPQSGAIRVVVKHERYAPGEQPEEEEGGKE